MNDILVKVFRMEPEAIVPQYHTDGSAGFDFHALYDVRVFPASIEPVPTGLILEIPQGFELQIRPRSGLGKKYPNYITNSPGTIDSDYRGEIIVYVRNPSNKWWEIKQGDRIAQGIIAPVSQAEFKIVAMRSHLSPTKRGAKGFGSTGGSTDSDSKEVKQLIHAGR